MVSHPAVDSRPAVDSLPVEAVVVCTHREVDILREALHPHSAPVAVDTKWWPLASKAARDRTSTLSCWSRSVKSCCARRARTLDPRVAREDTQVPLPANTVLPLANTVPLRPLPSMELLPTTTKAAVWSESISRECVRPHRSPSSTSRALSSPPDSEDTPAVPLAPAPTMEPRSKQSPHTKRLLKRKQRKYVTKEFRDSSRDSPGTKQHLVIGSLSRAPYCKYSTLIS